MLPFIEIKENPIFHYAFENFDFAAHFHSGLELVPVTKGTIHIIVDNESHTVHAGEIAVIFPYHVHEYRRCGQSENQGDVLLIGNEYLNLYLDTLLQKEPSRIVFSLDEFHPDVRYGIHSLLGAFNEEYCVQNAYVQLILCRLLPSLPLLNSRIHTSDDIHCIIQYLSTHFQEPLSLSSVAQALRMDKYQLSRIFSQRLHINFNQYINRLRIEYALMQMRSGNATVTACALDAGFNNTRSFYRTFEQVYHTTPKEYLSRLNKS